MGGLILLRDCLRGVTLTTLFHEVKIAVEPSQSLTDQQMEQLLASVQDPIDENELASLWQQAEHTATKTPSWLPHEVSVWVNYRIALVVRLLVRDVCSLSQ